LKPLSIDLRVLEWLNVETLIHKLESFGMGQR